MRRAVAIDTDPGLDDAVAIMLALNCPELDVLGLTAVAGNIGIEETTRNAGRILAAIGRSDVPVISGEARPLRRPGFGETKIHGGDGLGGVAFPKPLVPAATGAVDWLSTGLAALPAGSIDILALAPLTNIARLVRSHPDAARRIGRIIAMGGAINEAGNVGPHSEFNIANDPEAADIVFGSGLPVTLIPLDVTRQVRADRAYVAGLRQTGTAAAMASADVIEAYFGGTQGRTSRPLHDPCVMVMALRPELFGVERMTLDVDVGHGEDAGKLSRSPDGYPVDVAMSVDVEGVLAFLTERLGGQR